MHDLQRAGIQDHDQAGGTDDAAGGFRNLPEGRSDGTRTVGFAGREQSSS